MTLDGLIEQIRHHSQEEVQAEGSRLEEAKRQGIEDRRRRVAQILEEAKSSAEREAARERTQRLAGARMAARKLNYEAQERQVTDALAQSRGLLAAFTRESDYPQVLKRMYATAVEQLGKSVKIYGRGEDAAALKTLAGKNYDDRTAPILGGLIAETPDGDRRLNLSFDELLRRREDLLRELLAH
jgi:vacuolar-type H+-ATPase subunit E/Vma4